MKTTLRCGIVIHDNRAIQCGIQIVQETRYMSLAYSHEKGFYLNIKGVHLFQGDIEGYLRELELLRDALSEANELL